jgi:hypothetical protein
MLPLENRSKLEEDGKDKGVKNGSYRIAGFLVRFQVLANNSFAY